MREPFISNGRDVYIDPSIPGDGAASMDAAMIIPPQTGFRINGAPVIELDHEYVIQPISGQKPSRNLR